MRKHQNHNHRLRKIIFLFVFISLSVIALVNCTNSNKQKEYDLLSKKSVDGYVPLIRSFPSSANRINNWIINLQTDSIRGHAWDIWEYVNMIDSTSNLPRWETWHTGTELFDTTNIGASGKLIRDFENPSQFFHASVKSKTTNSFTDPLSFNRFSNSLFNFIKDKGYNKKRVLKVINDSFKLKQTPIIDRQIQTSKDSVDAMSFALKPVFQFIDATKPTAIPYWAGVSTESTTSLTNPEPYTWRQGVVVDPTGKLKPGEMFSISFNGEPKQELPVVSLSDFYTIKITQEDAENFSSFAKGSGDDLGKNSKADTTAVGRLVKKGNYALLVAMHVTGKEIKNWTWQTFWWSPNNQNPVFGKDRPNSINSPWSNYNMRTAYYMVAPAKTTKGGEPLISYNPYLETNLSGKVPVTNATSKEVQWYGVFTNCMSCHRMAAYDNTVYYPNGFIDPADSLKFLNYTKTDFLWSIPSRAK